MYKKDIPRVSNIVSYVFPFNGEGKQRYLEWLKNNWILQEEYLNWANELWTFVHKQMENHLLSNPIEDNIEVKAVVNKWIEYLKTLKYKTCESELYLSNDFIQGTCDVLFTYKDKIVLWDFKTYWIVKRRYWKVNKFQVDKHKREKVQLQMSIYAYLYHKQYWIKIDEIVLLFLHDDWVREYKLDIIDENKIEDIIKRYYISVWLNNNDFNININDMKIKIHKPSEQFWFIETELDLSKTDNWKTAKENIDDMIKVVQYSWLEYNKNLINK